MDLKYNSKFLYSFFGVLLLLTTGWLQTTLHKISTDEAAMVPLPNEFIGVVVDPRVIRRLLGVRLLAADLIWIDTLIKSDIVHEKVNYTKFYQASKSIVTLDPENIFIYYFSGLYLSVIKDDIKGATSILQEGVRYLEANPEFKKNPYAWRLYFTLGHNLIFEEHEFDEGAKYIEKTASYSDAPDFIKALSKRLSTESGRLEVAARVMNDIYRRVNTEEEKKIVEAKMLKIAVQQELADLNEKFTIFLTSTEAYALPRQKAFDMFLRASGRSKKNMIGNLLTLDNMGRIIEKK